MKREIKFRAWNGLLHEYRTIDMNSGKQNLGMGFESTEGIGSNTTTIYHSFGDVIEQFTGLKDKNGREIYEGDIVRSIPISKHEKSFVGIVQYGRVDPSFTIHDKDGHDFRLYSSGEYRTYEVIGNILENPELLEAEK